MKDPSKAMRDELHRRMGEIEAEAGVVEEAQKNLHTASGKHMDRLRQVSERHRAGLNHHDFDSDDALRYEGILRDRRRAALTRSHLDRALTGES
jgi:hypothetical protein